MPLMYYILELLMAKAVKIEKCVHKQCHYDNWYWKWEREKKETVKNTQSISSLELGTTWNKKKGGLCVSRGKYSEEKLDILTAGQNSAQGKTISWIHRINPLWICILYSYGKWKTGLQNLTQKQVINKWSTNYHSIYLYDIPQYYCKGKLNI